MKAEMKESYVIEYYTKGKIRRKKFASLEKAKALAHDICARTGVAVGIFKA